MRKKWIFLTMRYLVAKIVTNLENIELDEEMDGFFD